MLTKPASEVREISKAYPPPGAETDAKSPASGKLKFKAGLSPTLDLLSVKGFDQIKNYKMPKFKVNMIFNKLSSSSI